MSIEKATETEEKYFKAFPGLKKYFEKTKKETLERGFILTDEITKRRSYYDGWEIFADLKSHLEHLPETKDNSYYFNGLSKGFWTFYTLHKKAETDFFLESLKADVGKFFRIKGKFERDALNYPIQSIAASMTKLALIILYNHICENKLWGIVKIVNVIHDEIVIECPKHLAEKYKKVLIDCMILAGTKFCKIIPIEADAQVGLSWEH